MKNIILVGSLCVIGGCATTSQVENTDNRINELEHRLARIEGDLYKVEERTAPRQDKQPALKFVPAKDVEQNVIDAKIDSFLREYLGVAFGDGIDKYPKAIEDKDWLYERYRIVPVIKKFKYFDKALAHFEDGRLYAVSFFADIDKKYSIDSTNERINQARADLAVTLGLASNIFGDGLRGGSLRQRRLLRETSGAQSSYTMGCCNDELAPSGYRRMGVEISDRNLHRRILEEKKAREQAKGEQLPEAK